MSPPGFEAVRVLKHWFFFGLLYDTSPVGADSLCNDFYVMISDEISAGKVPEISIMIILLYFDEFIYLLLGALEIFLFQIRLDISSLIYRYLL